MSSLWKPAKFGGLNQMQWTILLLAVLLGTFAKQLHLMDLPDWFLDWVFPLLLVVTGHNIQDSVTRMMRRRKGHPQQDTDE